MIADYFGGINLLVTYYPRDDRIFSIVISFTEYIIRMDLETIDESKINQLIMMAEFKLWDAKRNNVPAHILDEIKLQIKTLKDAKVKKIKARSL